MQKGATTISTILYALGIAINNEEDEQVKADMEETENWLTNLEP